MRILITGVTGFAGGHLAEAACQLPDATVTGISRHGEWPPDLAHLAGRVSLDAADLSDGDQLESLLRRIEPDWIFHLAGYASPARSVSKPDAAWEGNLGITRGLYAAVERWGGRPRILYVGSGLIYGELRPGAAPFTEDMPLCPKDQPYALSKAQADTLSYEVARSTGLHIVRARPFNHIGPRQSTGYAIPDFSRQIAQIERGKQPPVIETLNLASMRDMCDVRDVVRAYILLLERGESGEAYNIASGRALPMKYALDCLLSLARVPIAVKQKLDPSRASESSILCGDPAKLKRKTGWEPEFSFEQSLADTLEYWRQAP